MPQVLSRPSVLILSQNSVAMDKRFFSEENDMLENLVIAEGYYEKLWQRIQLLHSDIILVVGSVHYQLQSRLASRVDCTTIVQVSPLDAFAVSRLTGALVNDSILHLLPEELSLGCGLGSAERFEIVKNDGTPWEFARFTGSDRKEITLVYHTPKGVSPPQRSEIQQLFEHVLQTVSHLNACSQLLLELRSELRLLGDWKGLWTHLQGGFPGREIYFETEPKNSVSRSDRWSAVPYSKEDQSLLGYLVQEIKTLPSPPKRVLVYQACKVTQSLITEAPVFRQYGWETTGEKVLSFRKAQRSLSLHGRGSGEIDPSCLSVMRAPCVIALCDTCYDNPETVFSAAACSLYTLQLSLSAFIHFFFAVSLQCSVCGEQPALRLQFGLFPCVDTLSDCILVEFKKSSLTLHGIVFPPLVELTSPPEEYYHTISDSLTRYVDTFIVCLRQLKDEVTSSQTRGDVVTTDEQSGRMTKVSERLDGLLNALLESATFLKENSQLPRLCQFLHQHWKGQVLRQYEGFLYAVGKTKSIVPLFQRCTAELGTLEVLLVEGDSVVFHREPTSYIAHALGRLRKRRLLGIGEGGSVASVSFQALSASCGGNLFSSFHITVDVFYFDEFRALLPFCLDGNEEDLVCSLTRCHVYRAEGGKTNADFFKTADGKFLLKVVKQTELYHIHEIHAKLFPYYQSRGTEEGGLVSALVPILGLYTVRVVPEGGTAPETGHYMLMPNLTPSVGSILGQYDLKGSHRNRVAAVDSAVQLDSDLLAKIKTDESYFFLTAEEKKGLMETLESDTELLLQCRVMDYSLVVYEGDASLVVGLVDYLHPYSPVKRIESTVKSGMDAVWLGPATTVDSPTIVDPQRYRERFLKWMNFYFCEVPQP